MALSLHAPGKEVGRKLKPHRKSRQGCGNCKLRSIKCDESKPSCKRCILYGVFCNYDCKHPDLQMSFNGAFKIDLLAGMPYSGLPTSPRVIIPSPVRQPAELLESSSFYHLTEQDLELLSKFQSRTVLTMTTAKNVDIYQKQIIRLAFSHPFLMHAVLSITLMHERHLSDTPNTKLSPKEAFHWYRGTALFNNKLSGPTQPSERDALWATSVLLAIIAIYYIEGTTPEEVWPLSPPSSLDLNWLRVGVGKNEIWKITQPWRPDCVFRPLMTETASYLPSPSAGPGLEILPSEFLTLYDLDSATSTSNDVSEPASDAAAANPYLTAALSFARSLNSNHTLSIALNFLLFLNHMAPAYTSLLACKDARALLLLAYWYAKVSQCQQHWWVVRRAKMECLAICEYLERYHGRDEAVRKFLLSPRMVVCGAASALML